MASNKHNNTLQYYSELLNKDKFDNGGMYLAKPKANVPYDPSSLNYYTQDNTTVSQPVKFGKIAYKSSTIQPKSSTNVVPQQLAPSHENDPKYQYFNPKEDVTATSGNKLEDMVYHNQWLLKTPIIGDIIKNKAKEYASSSGRSPIITEDLSKMQQDKENKYTGGTGKIDLIKQYFNKQGLTKSNYTPTSNYLNFLPSYSIKDNFNTMQPTDRNKLVQSMIDQQLNQTAGKYSNSKDPYSEAYNDFLKTKKPLYTQNDFDTDITNQLGVNLGGHKTGMAYDENVKLPYVSVSDAWDFSPDNYTKKWASKDNQDKARIQSTLMQKSGNPFKIYDRFYFDPNTKQYIPDDQVSQLKKKLGITQQMEQEQNVKSNVQSWLNSHKYADGGMYGFPIGNTGFQLPSQLYNTLQQNKTTSDNLMLAKPISIKDTRTVNPNSGKKLNQNTENKSVPYYDPNLLNDTFNYAKNYELSRNDAANLAAMALQETNAAKDNPTNPYHVKYSVHGSSNVQPVEQAVQIYKNAKANASKAGYVDDEHILQFYNGTGNKNNKIYPNNGEITTNMYGITIPKSGLNVMDNPIYGKQVKDLRDKLLMTNKDFLDKLNYYYPNK